MKVVMYHYVRKPEADLPFFNFLHANDFEQQLDYFLANYKVLSPEDVLMNIREKKVSEGIVLSFDDGLKDHFTYVLPALKSRGLKAFFFINTSWFERGVMPDVHAIHLLLGKYGGASVLQALNKFVKKEMVMMQQVEAYSSGESPYLTNNVDERSVKEILNYFLRPEHRRKVIDQLMEHFFPDYDEYGMRHYMSIDELKQLVEEGMILGGHTISHPVLSQLSAEEQYIEIEGSASFVHMLMGMDKMKVFCYPYGYKQTINGNTLAALTAQGFDFAFMVEPRDVTSEDVTKSKFALPRYDCNMFPYGSLFNK